VPGRTRTGILEVSGRLLYPLSYGHIITLATGLGRQLQPVAFSTVPPFWYRVERTYALADPNG
jgi:hypothetical protein